MYSTHNYTIADAALSDDHAFRMVGLFVLLTIRQPLAALPEQMQDAAANPHSSPSLFGAKRAGYLDIIARGERLRPALVAIADRYGHGSEDAAVRATRLLHTIPGLGAVKAGFYAQLLGFDVGCLDSHNLANYGISANAVIVRKTLKPRTRAMKLTKYVRLTRAHGGAEGLWNSWCDHVADSYHGAFSDQLTTGYEVSHFHERCIIGDLAPINPTEVTFS